MEPQKPQDQTFSSEELLTCVANILQAAGSAQAEAHAVAENLVMANLSGHDSHGVGMVPRYVDAILEGGLCPNAKLRIVLDTGNLLTLDAQRAYGQIAGAQAMEWGMARAKQHGSCIMALANAHHLGRIGHFAEMAVAQGLVAVHFVNVLARPTVAPWGGGDARFGTNPCCIGIPLGEDPPFVLDFATSRVAQGKMRVAYNKGQKVPEGYLIDEHGQPTTDPGVVVVPQANGMMGALMTLGEHKGYGLAVACELLGGALTGGGTWHQPPNQDRSVHNGMLTILVDPNKLGTQESFVQESHAFVEWLRQSPTRSDGLDPNTSSVLIAGEPERAARLSRGREGITVDAATWQEIQEAGRKVGWHAVI